MDELLKKYVYNVTKKLPKKVKAEVQFELEANIYEMLAGNETYDNLVLVLNDLGDPKELSSQYQNNNKTVVPNYLYEQYLLSLRMTLIIVSVLSFFMSSFYMLQRSSTSSIIARINNILLVGFIAVVIGIILSYAVVTFSFHIKGLIKPKIRPSWTIYDLDELPKDNAYNISKKKILIELAVYLILGVLAIFILTFYKRIKVLNIIIEVNSNVTVVFILLFIICLSFLIIKSALKLKEDKVNLKTTILDTILYIYTAVVLIVFILHPDLISYSNINNKTYYIVTITLATIIGISEVSKTAIIWIKLLNKN